MSKQKHTPGPWHIEPPFLFSILKELPDGKKYRVGEVDPWLGPRSERHDKSLAAANARLIAEAPTLLKIAKQALYVNDLCAAEPDQYGSENNWVEWCHMVREARRELIAIATSSITAIEGENS